MSDAVQNLAARYAEAIELEKTAWHALQAQPPGSSGRAEAWATWSTAITRTNRAWRQLSCQTLSRPRAEARRAAREAASPPLCS